MQKVLAASSLIADGSFALFTLACWLCVTEFLGELNIVLNIYNKGMELVCIMLVLQFS